MHNSCMTVYAMCLCQIPTIFPSNPEGWGSGGCHCSISRARWRLNLLYTLTVSTALLVHTPLNITPIRHIFALPHEARRTQAMARIHLAFGIEKSWALGRSSTDVWALGGSIRAVFRYISLAKSTCCQKHCKECCLELQHSFKLADYCIIL